MAVRELYGDSARESDWAAVRLRVRDGRIVDADASGLDADLRGLTLLEAAAVGGEQLPVDALANALAPAVRARPDTRRVAVAMSGGVDSAVALLQAGPHAVGVTLRLWVDPAGPRTERACCSPSAVLSARLQCHRLGIPHVTLDLREQFRRAVVAPFVQGYARGETPNPCIRCNGGFRFATLLAFARRVGAARLATGHYARIVERGGLLLLARARDGSKDQSYMLAGLAPRHLDRIWFPLGERTKAETRAAATAAGLAAAGRPESQEACFLAGDDYRAFLGRRGLRAERGPIVDEDGAQVGEHDGYWRYTRARERGGRASVRARDGCADEHRDRRAPGLPRAASRLGTRPPVRRRPAGRGQAALPVPRRSGDRDPDRVRVRAHARGARLRRRPRPDGGAVRRRGRRRLRAHQLRPVRVVG